MRNACRLLISCLLLGSAGLLAGELRQPDLPPPSFKFSRLLPGNAQHPVLLAPGILVSIYGHNLSSGERSCVAPRLWDPKTYPPELCGTRVLVGGIAAPLLYVSRTQINLQIPNHPWAKTSVGFQVIRDGRASPVVPVWFGVAVTRPELSLAEPAYAGMPVWIHVELPYRERNSIRYPFLLIPWFTGEYKLEVRRHGRDLDRVEYPDVGGVTGVIGGFSVGLPGKTPEAYRQRFPLHLLYHLGKPGVYEVRYTHARRNINGKTTLERSEWTPIEILPSTARQRREWLRKLLERRPTNVVELLCNYLPSILAEPNQSTLQRMLDYTHHPSPLVERYALNALSYYGKMLTASKILHLVERYGPSQELAWTFSRWRDRLRLHTGQLVEILLPYLRSNTPATAGSAIQMLGAIENGKGWSLDEAQRRRIRESVFEDAPHILALGDRQALAALAVYLGQVKSEGARALLWRVAEHKNAREQALICLTWIGNARDLPRIGELLKKNSSWDLDGHQRASLASALRRAYGARAIPYLESGLSPSQPRVLRRACAEELLLAGRPAGFRFFLEKLRRNRQDNRTVLYWLRNHIRGLKGASEEDVENYLKSHATTTVR